MLSQDLVFRRLAGAARRSLSLVILLLTGVAAVAARPALTGQGESPADPFAFFRPQVTLNPAERSRLDRGETLVKSVAPVDGQVAIFSVAKTQVTGDRLVRWVRRVDAMKRGRYAPAVVRFSDPPHIDDLRTLELDPADLDALRNCRPGACGLKLSETEIAQLSGLARSRRAGWQAEVQQAFRAVVLARARAYLAEGFAGLPPYRDQERPVVLADEFQKLLTQTPFLSERAPLLTGFFRQYPAAPTPAVESFLYWSKEILGRKPVVSITHVGIQRPDSGPDVVVASRQVFATHYMSGSIAVTAIVGGRETGPRYLAYFNRSRVDVLDGMFGGLVRRIVERRLRDEADDIVAGLRTRLESGEPQ